MYCFLYHTKMLAYKPKSFTKELYRNSLSPGVTNNETELKAFTQSARSREVEVTRDVLN